MQQFTVTQVTTRADLVQNYPEVFKQPDVTFPGMEVTPEARSVIKLSRRIQIAFNDAFKKELNKLIQKNVIALHA